MVDGYRCYIRCPYESKMVKMVLIALRIPLNTETQAHSQPATSVQETGVNLMQQI